MATPFGSSVLTLDDISTRFRHTFEGFVDARKGKNKHYSLTDAALSAFSVFFTQSPSFLDFQRTLELTHGNNNARTLFGVHEIPSDNQIRNLLDNTPPQHLDPLYSFIFNALDNASIIDTFHSFNDSLLVALDGVEYFSSKEIHCEHCSTRQHANGQITYSHTVLTPVVLKPSCKEVIPLAPEFILPQDGAVKQDCELNAGKRWLHRYQKEFGRHKVTLLGDDLYSHEPFCRDALAHGFDFIYVCKKSSHTTLYEWLDYLQGGDGIRTVTRTRWTGKRHETDTYRYAQSVPLRDGKAALHVQWFELVTTDEAGKEIYRNAFVTNHAVSDKNVAEAVEAGRGRWKIENENNNTLKTKGYHFEHNYGHGKKHLSSLLASLIILAFLTHTVMEWMDDKYRLLRQKLPSRQRMFNDIRALTSYLCFESWDALMAFMLQSFEPIPPARPKTG
jgi:hypothetical protein